jgi:hypothetical protein
MIANHDILLANHEINLMPCPCDTAVCAGSPSNPANGVFSCGLTSQPGAVCRATCAEGYTGSPNATCSANSEWQGFQGTCEQIGAPSIGCWLSER